jgi:protein ImuA
MIASPRDKADMTQPSAFSVMRNRTAVAQELRRLLPKIEGFRATKSFPVGLAAIDRYLPQGGLACGALHEIVPGAGATPAAFGFVVALLARLCATPPREKGLGVGKVFFVVPTYGLRDYGRPHGHGLRALGLDPRRLIVIETAHRRDTLWAMEEALRSRAPAAVAGVIDKLDLKTSQRLQLAATDSGLPLFLLRPAAPTLPSPACGGGWGEGSAAATRWRIGTAPAARDRFGLIERSRWQLRLERCRNGRAGEWMVEYDHVAHRFSLAAALADPAYAGSAGEKPIRQAC